MLITNWDIGQFWYWINWMTLYLPNNFKIYPTHPKWSISTLDPSFTNHPILLCCIRVWSYQNRSIQGKVQKYKFKINTVGVHSIFCLCYRNSLTTIDNGVQRSFLISSLQFGITGWERTKPTTAQLYLILISFVAS